MLRKQLSFRFSSTFQENQSENILSLAFNFHSRHQTSHISVWKDLNKMSKALCNLMNTGDANKLKILKVIVVVKLQKISRRFKGHNNNALSTQYASHRLFVSILTVSNIERSTATVITRVSVITHVIMHYCTNSVNLGSLFSNSRPLFTRHIRPSLKPSAAEWELPGVGVEPPSSICNPPDQTFFYELGGRF
jgi:hypothetical protein